MLSKDCQDDKERVDSIFQVSSSANAELYRKIFKEDKDMCTTFMEIMKDDIDKKVQQGVQQGTVKTLHELVNEGIFFLSFFHRYFCNSAE